MIQNAAFRILNCFTSSDTITFAVLCKQAGYPTDLGGYYLRQLVRGGYLAKQERGQYTISPKGKALLAAGSNRQPFVTRPRVTVLLVAKQGERFVALQRQVQPFIGIVEWPAGALRLGESLQAGAQRILKNRFGIDDTPAFVGFFRRIDTYGGEVFDDKLFAVHSATIPDQIELDASNDKGKLLLYSKTELHGIPHPSKSLLGILTYAEQRKSFYEEHAYRLQISDFSP